ncbi:MAG: glycosyltransferase family A protein [Pseudomonadota bacterium]
MASPRFSVLLPTNGSPETIGVAVQSVLDQSFRDFELLVVGDGADDETARIVSSIDDPRLKWMPFEKGPNYGYNNRNKALVASRGTLIAFAQHDDLMLPDHLARFDEMYRRRPNLVWAYSRPLWVDDEGFVLPFFVNLISPRERRNFVQKHCVLPTSCIVMTRAALEEAGWFDDTLKNGSDWIMWRKIVGSITPGEIGFCRTPTLMHFRAKRKELRYNWGPVPVGNLGAMARSGVRWPSELTVPVPDGAVPQVAVAAHLANHANALARVRMGVEMLQDNLAWSASHSPLDHATM